MRTLLRLFWLLCLPVVVLSGAKADPFLQNDLAWLQVMAFAAHQTDYSGVSVYQYGDHVETSRITHVVDKDGEHGRMESLDGSQREVVHHNGQVWCYLGDGKVSVEQREAGREFPALLPQQIALLNENYRIRQAEEERVAGFHAHAIVFEPRDNMRYTHKMWADSVSGLLLKSEVLDERGAIIEQHAFTQLTIGGDIDRKWIATGRQAPSTLAEGLKYHHKDMHHPSVRETQALNSGWRVDALPNGFRKVAEVQRQMRGKHAPAIQLVFSDGLAGISVFIEKADNDDDDHPGLISRGMLQVYSKLVDDRLVTVVGEVPPRTVMQVADSVRNGGKP